MLWSYNFLEWGILLSLPVAVSVKVNVFLLPSLPPPFSSFFSVQLSQLFFVSIHLFIFFTPPLCSLSVLFSITQSKRFSFRFINRRYTSLFFCLSPFSFSLHCFLFFLSFSANPSLCWKLHCAVFLPSYPHTSHSKLPCVSPPSVSFML